MTRRTRLTTYALAASSGDHGRMYEWWEVLTCHQTTFLWQQWNFTSRDSPPPTAHGQSTTLDCSETRTHKQLSNRFQPLQELIEDNETDIETQWEHCKKLWQDTCEEVLGKKKTQHKEWISADTIHKLETRRERKTVLNNSRTRAAKARAQEEYTAVDREVKRSIKKDKRDYIDDLARQAETAAGQRNLRDLYLVTKKLTGKFQQTDKPVMDKNGNPLTTTNEQLKRWAEHFRELLNRPTPDSPPDIPLAETELPISCDKP